MNVLVLIAGVADPKQPLEGPYPRIASPFDESALEVALKLRDADPSVKVHIVLVGTPADESLARALASHRPDRIDWIETPADVAWDAVARAAALAGFVRAVQPAPQLVLIGREFGDFDDGALPACLAASLDRPLVALGQEVTREGASLVVLRERAGFAERISFAAPLVASITNDRRNRLRHPLFKNVMTAKRMALACGPVESVGSATLTLAAKGPMPEPVRAAQCRMVTGDIDAQAAALAEYLLPWRVAE